MIWGKIADWTGGLGNKIEVDKAQENLQLHQQQETISQKEIVFCFWNGKGRRKIKYCSVGHLVGHIYY